MNKYYFCFILIIVFLTNNILSACAYDTYMSPEIYQSYGKQQIRSKNEKGNTILVTPNYKNYADRNAKVSEKVVAIYDKHSPAYGYRYVLYTPIGRYVGHHKIMQQNPNGYGYEPIPDGGEGSLTPCFKTIRDAKHFYYPQWY